MGTLRRAQRFHLRGAKGKPAQSDSGWDATSCAEQIVPFCAPSSSLLPAPRWHTSCRRRDVVEDRRGEQPLHAHPRRLQRPGRQPTGRTRSTVQVPSAVEGYVSVNKAGPASSAPARTPRLRPLPHPPRARGILGARADGRLHRPRGRHALRPGRRRGRLGQAIAATNGLDPDGVLVAGTVIKLPTGAPAPARAAARARHHGRAAAAPEPTATRVGAADVQSVASQHGAPPRSRPRSPSRRAASTTRWSPRQRARRHAGHAGHVGLRQQNLAQRQLNPNSAHDNVTAGVLSSTTCSTRPAATSPRPSRPTTRAWPLRSRGVFDDTKQYVADVQALRGRFGG